MHHKKCNCIAYSLHISVRHRDTGLFRRVLESVSGDSAFVHGVDSLLDKLDGLAIVAIGIVLVE